MSNFGCLDYCPELARLYAAGRTAGASGKEFDLGSCSTVNNLAILRNLCLTFKPSRTLEVGLASGGSCLAIATFHRETLGRPERRHLAIDPFQTSHWDQAGIGAVQRAGLADYVEVREALSCWQLPKLAEEGCQFDLVYIDGSHLCEDVFVDAYFVVRLLSSQGIVAFDDCRDPHVAKVIKFLRTNLKASLPEIDLSPYREDRGKSFKYQLARRLGRTQMTAFRRAGEVARAWDAVFSDF